MNHSWKSSERSPIQLFKRRHLMALTGVILFVILIIARLVYLQVTRHHFYATESQNNLVKLVPSPPHRGLIYDRNGVVLAKNSPTYNLTVVKDQMKHPQEMLALLQTLIPLSHKDIELFHKNAAHAHSYEPILLKTKLTEDDVAHIYVNQYRLPGVHVVTQMLRTYPLKDIASPVLGYVGRINQQDLQHIDHAQYRATQYIGKMGMEKYYENILHGRTGAEEVETDASGHVLRTLRTLPPVSGERVYLTIDSRLQQEAYEQLGHESGAVVMIDPNNGEVLALVSHPSFDPNLFVNGVSQKDYNALTQSPAHPLYNRAIRGQYAPGSTIKPFIGIMGLSKHVVAPSDQIYDPGWFRVPHTKHTYHDWKYDGHGWVNLSKAITVSCDVFFYNLATAMGIKKLDASLNEFGFGHFSGIDMPEETPGLVPTPHWKRGSQGLAWYTGDTVETGIGQGFLLATPLQLAVATATLSMHGLGYQPHILLKSVNSDGHLDWYKKKLVRHITLSDPKDWQVIIHAMQQVVSPIGTATFFGHHSFTVAAKTGTAQVYGRQRDEERIRSNLPKKLRNNHLFIAFAPANKPQVVIAVVVEHSAFADRITGHLLRDFFRYQKEDTIAWETVAAQVFLSHSTKSATTV